LRGLDIALSEPFVIRLDEHSCPGWEERARLDELY